MITGFGNNVISSLAADITAGQTTIQVMPGTGVKFAGLLNYDYANASNPLQTYAKISLTDAKETVFEICHLTSVNNDVLTVVRGQEGTTAKGWALNDVIANFATRGSENQFVQIEQLQSGHYISGVAGGTANALTLELPATYFVNGSTNWTLRTPIVVYPTQNNTGAATLQLTMGGRVLGTFKLYKGNKAELVANDILKDVALVCLLDKTKSFFNVSNPGAIYAGLGTAAFCDVTSSSTDTTLGRVPTVGWMGNGTSIALPENSDLNTIIRLVATYGVANPGSSAKNFPINLPGVLRISHNSDGRTLQEYTTFNPVVKYERALYSSGTWSAWATYYSENNKQPAIAFSFDIYGGGSGKTDFNSAPAGQTSYVYADANGAAPESALVIDYWGGYTTQRVQIAVSTSSGRTYTRKLVNTVWSSWDSIYSVNYKPPYPVRSVNNMTGDVTIPAPDLSPYATKTWVQQNFVQSIDLTAPTEVAFRDGGGYPRTTDGAAMYNFNMVGGSSNVGNFIIRYTRRLVNNVWYVLN